MTEWNKWQCKLLTLIIGITWWSLKNIHHSIFSILGRWNFLKFYTMFSMSKGNISDKNCICNWLPSNYNLLINPIQNVYLFSPTFLRSTDINALTVVYWPLQYIAIDCSSIGLKRLTIQPMFNEIWFSVLRRILHHNTSEVCTATLNDDHPKYTD